MHANLCFYGQPCGKNRIMGNANFNRVQTVFTVNILPAILRMSFKVAEPKHSFKINFSAYKFGIAKIFYSSTPVFLIRRIFYSVYKIFRKQTKQ
jgi:hypothetical protein